MIAASIDRRADVAGAYQVCDRDDAKNLVRLSAEWRLLDAAAARLLKHVETDVPQPMSQRWAKAQRAPEPGGIVPLADGDGGDWAGICQARAHIPER